MPTMLKVRRHASEQITTSSVLCIGLVSDDAIDRSHSTPGAITYCLNLRQITPALLEKMNPDVVLSTLFDREYDPSEVAEWLEKCGYTGRYYAVTEYVPKPDVILRDVRTVAPLLDFDVIMLSEAPPALH
ncbi:MAG: hypothetical protein AAFR50_11695 [Pseudomonadota bacterium]